MGYADPDQQREYQRQWIQRRRDRWFRDRACMKCGSTDLLEVHHRDQADRVTHRVWSWSWERREAELAKCDVLCRPCHETIHYARGRAPLDSVGRAAERAAVQAWLDEWDRRRAKRRKRKSHDVLA